MAPHTGACYVVDGNAGLFDCAYHTNVGRTFGSTAAQHKAYTGTILSSVSFLRSNGLGAQP